MPSDVTSGPVKDVIVWQAVEAAVLPKALLPTATTWQPVSAANEVRSKAPAPLFQAEIVRLVTGSPLTVAMARVTLVVHAASSEITPAAGS